MALLLSETQIDQIRERGLLQAFMSAECHGLLKDADLQRFEPGALIFKRGQWADELGWVLAGSALAVLPGAERDVPVLRLAPGDLVGFIAFIAEGQHILEVRAERRTDVLMLNRTHFVDARKRGDALFARLLMVLSFGAFEHMSLIQSAIPAQYLRI